MQEYEDGVMYAVLNNKIDNADYIIFTQYPDVDGISLKILASDWRAMDQPEEITIALKAGKHEPHDELPEDEIDRFDPRQKFTELPRDTDNDPATVGGSFGG